MFVLSKQRSILTILVVALFSAACSPDQLPSPIEVAERSDAIHEQVWQQDARLGSDPIDARVHILENTLREVALRYGPRSIELQQALTETVGLLASRDRFDLALPFIEQSLEVSRSLYGLEHRETAFALHDVGVVLASIDPEHRIPRAELMFRGARDIRQKLLGTEHGETAASETKLAWQLLLGARQQSAGLNRTQRLQEAEQLALHARKVFDDQGDDSYTLQLRRTALEAALALERLDDVEARAREIVADGDYELGPGLYPEATAYDLLLSTLRAQHRTAEADKLESERANKEGERESNKPSSE